MQRYFPRFDAQTVAGILLMAGSVALFTPVFAAAKFSSVAVPVFAILWMRYIGGFTTVWASVLATRTPLRRLKSPQPHLHLVRMLLGSSGGFCTIYAASVMPVVDAAAIGLTEGFMTVALAALLLREVVGAGHWLAGSLCAAGAFIVIRSMTGDTGVDGQAFYGTIAAIAGAFLIACESLMIKVLVGRESALGVLVHVNTMGAVLYAGPAVLAARWAGLDWSYIVPFLALGPVAIAAQLLTILAYRKADAALLAPVTYSWILFSALLGYVWFGEVPGPGLAIGGALIVCGGIWLTVLPTTRPEPPKIRGTT